MANKLFSELTVTTITDDTDIIAIELDGGGYRYIVKSDMLKDFNAIGYTETSFTASIATGTYTHDCNTNGNSLDLTITGAITMAQPTKTLSGDQYISGSMEIHGWDTHAITWSGADWDWGSAGVPSTKTARMLVWFYRKAGDTKTLAGLGGAFT